MRQVRWNASEATNRRRLCVALSGISSSDETVLRVYYTVNDDDDGGISERIERVIRQTAYDWRRRQKDQVVTTRKVRAGIIEVRVATLVVA